MKLKDFNIKHKAYFASGALTLYDNKPLRLEAWVEGGILDDEIKEDDLLLAINEIKFMIMKDGDFRVEILTEVLRKTSTRDSAYFIIQNKSSMFETITALLLSHGVDTSENKEAIVTRKDKFALFDVLMKLFFKNFR